MYVSRETEGRCQLTAVTGLGLPSAIFISYTETMASLAARIAGGDGKAPASSSGRSTPTGRAPSRTKQQPRPAPYVGPRPQEEQAQIN
jgi:hypothetical protein